MPKADEFDHDFKAEYLEILSKLNAYEQEAKIRLNAQVKVYTESEYSQEFLRELITRK